MEEGDGPPLVFEAKYILAAFNATTTNNSRVSLVIVTTVMCAF